MKVTAIAGAPGSGKTTLMKRVYEIMGRPQLFKFGLLRGHLSESKNVVIPGIYNIPGTFIGTDKLSMAVKPDFMKFAAMMKHDFILEGDRLVSEATLKELNDLGYELNVIVLDPPEKELKARRLKRGSNQNPTWLKGRESKVNKIKGSFDCDIREDWSIEELANLIVNGEEELDVRNLRSCAT